MVAIAADDDRQYSSVQIGDHARYTRVAMWLHWAIAAFILYNLISGLLIWDVAKDFFKAHRAFYGFGITTHLSAGMTVLALSVVRIVWRLTHEPPAYSAGMKPVERHASHVVHFLLYTAMVVMPLLGWAILSAHPPAGSPGSKVAKLPMAASPMARPAGGAAPAGPGGPGGPPARMGPPGIWWIVPLPMITPITNIGFEPGGVKPQHELHEQFTEWHKIGGYLMIVLLLAHIAGALKHQIIDKEPQFQRMGAGRRRPLV
ncbi:cytochrome b [Sphingomonas sp. UYP23]